MLSDRNAVQVLRSASPDILMVAIDLTQPARDALQEVASAIRHAKFKPLDAKVRLALDIFSKNPRMSFREAARQAGDVRLARAVRYWFTKAVLQCVE
jgi:hypothetical protein